MQPRFLATAALPFLANAAFGFVDIGVDQVIQFIGLNATPQDSSTTTSFAVGNQAIFSAVVDPTATAGDESNALIVVELLGWRTASNSFAPRLQVTTGQQGNTDRIGLLVLNGEFDFRFTFYTDASNDNVFNGNEALFPLRTQMQVSDIDLEDNERVVVNNSAFTGVTRAGNSALAVAVGSSTTSVTSNLTTTPKTDPRNAATFLSVANLTTFDVTVVSPGTANGYREYQFDFNNPPSITLDNPNTTPVPEPAATLAWVSAALALVVARRRR